MEKWLDRIRRVAKEGVRYVLIDMWPLYFHAVRRKLPKAKIVEEIFHAVKHLNERINTVRRKCQRNAPKEIAEVFKGSRWILVRNRKDLSARDEKKLKQGLEACPELRTIHLLKEEFGFIFERAKDRGASPRSI